MIQKNLNEKDVQNLYFGQLEHTTYIDITEWFIEFVELCYKVADKNMFSLKELKMLRRLK